MSKKPKIIAVVGPTASGKTALSIALAKAFDGEVISADSRQVYRELDLGTGKVTTEEMNGIPHHLLDVADPRERFSVAEFQKLGKAVISDILSRGKLPIVCGGTGLYVDTLLNGTALPEVPPNKELRDELEKLSAEELYEKLLAVDPGRAADIDRHNPVRLVRAIEIAEALGKVPKAETSAEYDALKIGLLPPDELLKEKIAKRLKERLDQGMLAEAERLHADGLSYERMEELGLEYRYMARVLQGTLSQEEFETQLQNEIWQYAKRQKTWFKRDGQIRWFENGNDPEIPLLAKRFLASSE
ncbi:MAG TPA: tRNA (adenosine(37)-N6)-dimethylallyltransferase MiaA [Candidatus Paceibacterota bacterium]|nr:tRNA (adenosine(37)-N6)-dimethylallyltransferase MiaA [Candidatus Paceibacterota bacterium]